MDVSSVFGASQPSVMSGASPAMGPDQKMGNLFDQIDSSGSGSITQNQLQKAFTTQNPPASFKAIGADSLFNKLAQAGSTSVSKQDFVSGMSNVRDQIRNGSSSGSPSQTLDAASQSLNALTTPGTSFSITV